MVMARKWLWWKWNKLIYGEDKQAKSEDVRKMDEWQMIDNDEEEKWTMIEGGRRKTEAVMSDEQ
jgi:hypothetical protein